MTVLY